MVLKEDTWGKGGFRRLVLTYIHTHILETSEAACLIVSVDETIKNPRSTVDASPAAGRGRGRGRLH